MDTTTFVAAVRRQGVVPSSYADTDVMGMGDGEINAVFVPLLERVRQNYFVREATVTADARGRHAIPDRAISGGLRSVQLALGNGWVPLPQLELADADYITGGPWPTGYVLDGGSIKLLPSGASGVLRVRYACRPSRMVSISDTTQCTRINTVTPGASTVLLNTNASTIAGAYVDIVSRGPTHILNAINAPFTGAFPNITLQLTDLQEMPVGWPSGAVSDMVCAPGVTPYVPLPEELSAALVHRTAGAILRALGYIEEAAQQLALAGEVIDACIPMLMPRNEGNPKTVSGGLRASLRRSSVGRRTRWW